jgi:hypothetical protein
MRLNHIIYDDDPSLFTCTVHAFVVNHFTLQRIISLRLHDVLFKLLDLDRTKRINH